MKSTLIIVGHPAGVNSTTQQFLYQTSQAYTSADVLILADEISDMTHSIDGDRYRDQLAQYDRLIFQFPMYWYQAPSLLKFWMDEVFQDWQSNPGWAQKMQGKEFGVVITADVAATRFHPGEDVGVTIDQLLSPYQALATYYRMEYLAPFAIHRFSMMDEPTQMRLMLTYACYLSTGKQGSLRVFQQFISEQLAHPTISSLPLDSTQALTFQMWQEDISHQAEELEELFTMNGRWY